MADEPEEARGSGSDEDGARSRPFPRPLRWILLLAGAVFVGWILLLAGIKIYEASIHADPAELVLMSDAVLVPGTRAAARAWLRDHDTGLPAAGAPVRVSLRQAETGAVPAGWDLETDARGIAEFSFEVPDSLEVGTYILAAEAELDGTRVERVQRSVEVLRSFTLSLAVDGPIYRPGQEIRMRVLALHGGRGTPAAGTAVALEVRNAAGIRILRKTLETSRFGIASASLPLAPELQEGNLSIRASVGRDSFLKTVRVERAPVSAIRVALALDRNAYLPGEIAHCRLEARTPFGQPVAGGAVSIEGDFEPLDHEQEDLRTDDQGLLAFDLAIPESGPALVPDGTPPWRRTLFVVVRDTAGRVGRAERPVDVADPPYRVRAVPEGGRLAPGLDNRFFLSVTGPGGTPVRASVVLDGPLHPPVALRTDAQGIASFVRTVPAEFLHRTGDRVHAALFPLRCVIREEGREPATVEVWAGDVQIRSTPFLLTPDRAEYRAGETAVLDIRSPALERETLFLDVTRDGQTLAVRSVDVEGGNGTLELHLDETLTGSVALHLYRMNASGAAEGDSRLVTVHRVDAPRVTLRPDRETYEPGDEARIRVALTDPDGSPRPGALSLDAVDDAAFDLLHADGDALEAAAGIVRLPAPGTWTFYTAHDLETFSLDVVDVGADFVLQPWDGQAPVPASSHAPKSDEAEFQRSSARVSFQTALTLGLGAVVLLLLFGLPVLSLVLWSADHRGARIPFTLWAAAVLPFCCVLLAFPRLASEPETGPRVDRAALRVPEPEESAAPRAFTPRTGIPVPDRLLWVPELLTDEEGRAELAVPLADAVTSTRLTAQAVTGTGARGFGAIPLRVDKTFSVDLDVPRALTRGDVVALPALVRSRAGDARRVRLVLEAPEGVVIVGGEERFADLGPGATASATFAVRASRVGSWRLRLTGVAGDASHAVERALSVVPEGVPVETASGGLLGADGMRLDFFVPETAVEDSQQVRVKVYPGSLASVLDGLDGLGRMCGGDFEQAASRVHCAVLAMNVLKKTRTASPELEQKLEAALARGLQQILAFRTPGGGFQRFGGRAAQDDVRRTASALALLAEMDRLQPVDPKLLRDLRSQVTFLQADGGWWSTEWPPAAGLPEWEETREPQATTACVAEAMARAGVKDWPVRRAVEFMETGRVLPPIPYETALEVLCRLRIGADAGAPLTALAAAASVNGASARWPGPPEGPFGARGETASLETTALAAQCFLLSGTHPALARKAVALLLSRRRGDGTWGSPHATVQALDALVLAAATGPAVPEGLVLRITLDGEPVGTLPCTGNEGSGPVVWEFSGPLPAGPHALRMEPSAECSLACHALARVHVPASDRPAPAPGPVRLEVRYDRSSLAVGQVLGVKAFVSWKGRDPVAETLAEIGIPPGFEPLEEDLDAVVGRGVAERWERRDRTVVFTLGMPENRLPLVIGFGMVATRPMKGTAPRSRVWESGNPEAWDDAPGVPVEAR